MPDTIVTTSPADTTKSSALAVARMADDVARLTDDAADAPTVAAMTGDLIRLGWSAADVGRHLLAAVAEATRRHLRDAEAGSPARAAAAVAGLSPPTMAIGIVGPPGAPVATIMSIVHKTLAGAGWRVAATTRGEAVVLVVTAAARGGRP